jgi:hypothetical protein
MKKLYNILIILFILLSSLSVSNAQTGWAVGSSGRILKTTTGGIIFLQPISNKIPGSYKLYQNYPNPFNPTKSIKFQVASSTLVKLIVYDVLGKVAAEPVNKELQPGTYEVNFDGNNLANGIYFYTLSSGEFRETRRAVLIK